MNDAEIRRSLSLNKMNDFGEVRAADFPPASLGGKKFAEVKALVSELDALGEEQASADGAVRAATAAKGVSRVSILQKMRVLRDTVKAMEAEMPGVSSNFKVPSKNGDEALVNGARAFVAAATSLKDALLEREMEPTLVEDLTAETDKFEEAANSVNVNTGKRVGATAAIKSRLQRATKLKAELDPIVRNKYRDDPASLAAWKSATHVELPPKPKTKTPPPPPPVK